MTPELPNAADAAQPKGEAMVGGLGHIVVTTHALVETEERLFPASRHRSKRIRKKLIKRYGGEFRMKPAAFQTPNGIIMHPALYAQLKQRMKENTP